MAPKRKITTFIVIPCYNCSPRLQGILNSLAKRQCRVVVVDDGSNPPLDVSKPAKTLAGRLALVRHPKNRGYGAALATGIKKAAGLGAKTIVLMDGDGQHEIKYLHALVKPIAAQGAQFVTGTRYGGIPAKQMPRGRDLAVRIITLLANFALGCNLTDAQCGFRAMTKDAALKILPTEPGMESSLQMLALAVKKGVPITQVPVGVTYEVESAHTNNAVIGGLGLFSYLVRFKLLAG